MEITETIALTLEQKQHILELWNREYPAQIKYHDLSNFESYLGNLNDQKHYLLTEGANKICGWGFTFARDGEKWFAIILDKAIQRSGYGTLLLNKLKEKNNKLSGWVIDHDSDKKQNGEYYISPLNFYLKNGFSIAAGIRLENIISAIKIEWTK